MEAYHWHVSQHVWKNKAAGRGQFYSQWKPLEKFWAKKEQSDLHFLKVPQGLLRWEQTLIRQNQLDAYLECVTKGGVKDKLQNVSSPKRSLTSGGKGRHFWEECSGTERREEPEFHF